MTPKISVVFPVADREAYLREALESVLAQTFEEFELLVILDGVMPAVDSVVSGYADVRIRTIRLPLNMGVSAARNAGLRLARAPLIALMDSDDVALPQRFARQHAWMERHADVTVCASNAIKLMPDGRRVPMRYPESDGVIKARLLLVDSSMLNPTTMMRTDFIRRHGIHYDPSLRRDQDHAFFVEMLRKGARFHGLQDELLLYRRHDANATLDRSGADEDKARVRERILPVFFPELDTRDTSIFLRGMCEQVHLTVDEAYIFMGLVSQGLQETRSFAGEDRAELGRILRLYRDRVFRSLVRALGPALKRS